MRLAAGKERRRLPSARVTRTIALRITVAIAAAVSCYVLLEAHASDGACEEAGQRVFRTSGGFEPLAGLRPAIDDVRGECDGAAELTNAAEVIRQASADRPELAPLAVEVAREATEEEPDNFVTWATLAAAQAPIDPNGARESFARAKELNPRLRVPAVFRSPPPEPR
jgi:hypothetical protein